MRKQLLACAVLAATMVPSLAGAAIISVGLSEPGAPIARQTRVLRGSNGLPNNRDTGNFFTTNITGVTQPGEQTNLLLLAKAITATNAGVTGNHTTRRVRHGAGFDDSDR